MEFGKIVWLLYKIELERFPALAGKIFGHHEWQDRVECRVDGRQEKKVHWHNEVQELYKVDDPNEFAKLMNLHLQMTLLLNTDFKKALLRSLSEVRLSDGHLVRIRHPTLARKVFIDNVSLKSRLSEFSPGLIKWFLSICLVDEPNQFQSISMSNPKWR